MQHFVRPDGMPPANGYSHAVAFTGATVAVSGQLPLDADGKVVGEGDAEAQTRQVFQNLERALAAASAGFADVVKLSIYLTDLADLPAFRRVRDEFIDVQLPPASSAVQVAGLVIPGCRIEVDALAVLR